jgi:hypothetical protein
MQSASRLLALDTPQLDATTLLHDDAAGVELTSMLCDVGALEVHV